MEAFLLGQRAKLGKVHQKGNGKACHNQHHAHQAQHDLKVRVHAVAEQEVRILLDPLVRLGHLEVHATSQCPLEPAIEAPTLPTEAATAYVA